MRKVWFEILSVMDFLRTGIWQFRLVDMPGRKSFFLKQLRVFVLALRGIDQDKCFLRASALTLYTLLSLVPVIAMAFGIAKGFGMETVLEKELLARFAGHEEVIGRVIGFARSLLDNTEGGTVAGVGVAVLLYSVLKVMGNIERTFNGIWEIKKARTLKRKFTDYLSIILIAPMLIIVSGSITIFITSQVALLSHKIAWIGAMSGAISLMLKVVPYFIIWSLFTFIYIFVPNTKVKFKSALMAGVFAGTIYQLTQWLYISFQVGIAKYNAIYGSFAALPLFLIWLQVSWLVLLFGAELSFANQNVDTYELEPYCRDVSYDFKRLLSLQLCYLIITDFCKGGRGPHTADDLAHTLSIPIRLVRALLGSLVESKVLMDCRIDDSAELYYQLAMDPGTLTVSCVLKALDATGNDTLPVHGTRELGELKKSLGEFRMIIEKSSSNRLLRDI